MKKRLDRLCEKYGLHCNGTNDYDGKNGAVLAVYVRIVPSGSNEPRYSVFLETDGGKFSASIGMANAKVQPKEIQEFETELAAIFKDAVGADNVKFYRSSSTPL